jgi:outer membrane protein assembly factor BamB
VEGLFNFHDGFIYASAANGSFYRIDPETGIATYLFTPVSDRPSRLTSLAQTGDGAAYGVTGREGKCEFMRVDYRRGTFEKLGAIEDEDGVPLWQCHHIVDAGNNTFYLCENDNPFRSGYLWELTL